MKYHDIATVSKQKKTSLSLVCYHNAMPDSILYYLFTITTSNNFGYYITFLDNVILSLKT